MMKHTSKHNDGFTLIELVVAMAVAVIVTAAATSVLLFGLRVNRQSADTASRQMTVRALLNVVEKAAADGNIKSVITDFESWQLVDTAIDKNDKEPTYRVIFGFDSASQTIYTGREYEDGSKKTEGTIVLEGVYASNAIIEGKLLSVSVETKEGIFASSIYCRIVDLKDNSDSNELPGVTGEDPRGKFIGILKSQYRSRGEIRDESGNDTGEYYSEWYINKDYDDTIDDDGWNAKTPWCACYISWALDKAGKTSTIDGHPRWFANVDEFMAYFQHATQTGHTWNDSKANGGDYSPEPGDLIFFDWNKGTNPQHVGVVLEVVPRGNTHIIYTIEGNSSGRVAIRSYSINDPRIIGYGVLSW